MHSMRARHGRRVIAGGAFKGSTFEDLSHDQLVRASKRYPGDPKLQKYAKAVVAARELDGGADPLPCKPLMLRDGTVSSPEKKKPWTIKAFLWEMFRTTDAEQSSFDCCHWCSADVFTETYAGHGLLQRFSYVSCDWLYGDSLDFYC